MNAIAQFALTYILARFARDERGVTMLEYAILLGIITVAAIAFIATAGDWVTNQWSDLSGTLNNNP